MSKRRRAPQSATSLEMAPEQDERGRERKYLITMGIRMACFALAVFIYPYGWHTAVLAVGAVFLPWIAVVIANARATQRVDHAVAPEAPRLPAAADGAEDRAADGPEIVLHETRAESAEDERPRDDREGDGA